MANSVEPAHIDGKHCRHIEAYSLPSIMIGYNSPLQFAFELFYWNMEENSPTFIKIHQSLLKIHQPFVQMFRYGSLMD